ncbi:DUF6303 family protein [Streptomyces sp. SID9727]|uniref:DUF6303 family protein n=1 Tax=Streptomyces sp. SID9727 TaxID=2706114 RepID=UPI0013C72038|nr:DUF6303 family protein [Streptomyces sp. SID9727]NEC69346.1 hypothetical protein [Streptomyces sp. SID9727]
MTTADTFTAQMSIAPVTGRWRLYVVIYGELVSEWPEYVFDGATVPSVQDRPRALNALGYTFTDGPAWDWTEDHVPGDDPAGPVHLIASARVREVAS